MKPNLVSTSSVNSAIPRLLELKQRLNAKAQYPALVSESALKRSLLRPKFADRQQLFYVSGGGASGTEISAAVVARVSPSLRDDDGKPVGMLGFFDSVDAIDLAEEILCAADGWLREKGCESIVGPMDGDTWHAYRFNVGPHPDPPFLLEPSNEGYYPHLFLNTGFEVLDRYYSLRVDDIERVLPTLQPAWESAVNRGYRFRNIRMENFEQDLRAIYETCVESFQGNFLYDEISWDEFLELYQGVKRLIRPELIWFVEDGDGHIAGFLFCLIDYFRAVASMKGRSGAFAKLKFLWNRSSADCVNFKSIAVLPDFRRERLAGALMYLGYRESQKLGFSKANLCLIREGNPSAKLDGGHSRILRQYELYQTPGSRLEKAKCYSEQ